ncbi:hypothetical protein KEJ34_02895 [Candidatus Bathyarchaeota archaeon]|nr:hypothetical protein [Candidatus Bathyarchaeota archaeon]
MVAVDEAKIKALRLMENDVAAGCMGFTIEEHAPCGSLHEEGAGGMRKQAPHPSG